jgi:hypothetical protein
MHNVDNIEWFSVSVSRINDGVHDPKSVTIVARHVTLEENGALVIWSEHSGNSFSASHWDTIEVKKLTRMQFPR